MAGESRKSRSRRRRDREPVRMLQNGPVLALGTVEDHPFTHGLEFAHGAMSVVNLPERSKYEAPLAALSVPSANVVVQRHGYCSNVAAAGSLYRVRSRVVYQLSKAKACTGNDEKDRPVREAGA